MKTSTLLTLLFIASLTQAKLPDRPDKNGFINQASGFFGDITQAFNAGGLKSVTDKLFADAWSSALLWSTTVQLDKNTILAGMGVSSALLVVQAFVPQFSAFIEATVYAYNFSFSNPVSELVPIVAKLGLELFHQVEGPTSANEWNKVIAGIETVADIALGVTFLIQGKSFNFGTSLIDTAKNFALLSANPFLDTKIANII